MFQLGNPKKLPGRALAVTTTTALVFAGSLAMASSASAAPLTVSVDPALGACIQANFPGTTFTVAGLDGLNGSLDCSNANINSLLGVQYLSGLTSLDLSDNHITDLGNIGQLTDLAQLNLAGNDITSLTGLSGLTDLTGLDLSGNDITSLAGLQHLTDLLDLDLSGNAITSLLPIDDLTNLLKLDLGSNGITDIVPLEDLTSLLSLDLSHNPLQDLTGLGDLTHLLNLDLSDDLLSNLAPLGDLAHLLNLDLSNNPINDITQILGVDGISNLDIFGTLLDPAQLGQLTDLLQPVTSGDLTGVLSSAADTVTGVLNGGPLDGLLNGGLLSGDLLNNLLGGNDSGLGTLVGSLLDQTIDLNGLLDSIGLSPVFNQVFPPDTIIVNVPPANTPVNPAPDAASIQYSSTPSISGTTTFGKTLSANSGAWDANGFSYQWFRGDAAIAGAQGNTYKLVAGDIKNQMSVVVTGYKSGATAISHSSPRTVAVAAAKFTKTVVPKISGTSKVKKTLKAKVTGVSKSIKVTYQWYQNGKKISKATKASYKLVKKYAGKKITVKATYKQSGYTTVVRTSKATKKVAK